MEKTILFCSNTDNEYVNASWYHLKNCKHQHCSLLIQQIKRMNKALNNLRQSASQRNLKKSNNNSQDQNKQNATSYSYVLQQIKVLKQNYGKAMKLLQHFQKQNDQLFQENQKIKSQMKYLKQTKIFNKKNNLQLQYSETKWSDNIDNIDGKHSFYTQTTQRLYHQEEPSKLDDLELNFNLTPLEGSCFLPFQLLQKNNTQDQFYNHYLNQIQPTPSKYNQNTKFSLNDKLISQTNNEKFIELDTFQKLKNDFGRKIKTQNYQIKRLKQMLKNRNSIQTLRNKLISQLESALTLL